MAPKTKSKGRRRPGRATPKPKADAQRGARQEKRLTTSARVDALKRHLSDVHRLAGGNRMGINFVCKLLVEKGVLSEEDLNPKAEQPDEPEEEQVEPVADAPRPGFWGRLFGRR